MAAPDTTQSAGHHSAGHHSAGHHSSQGGTHGPSKGKGPLGTWFVIAVLTLAIFLMWFLVLGIMEARA